MLILKCYPQCILSSYSGVFSVPSLFPLLDCCGLLMCFRWTVVSCPRGHWSLWRVFCLPVLGKPQNYLSAQSSSFGGFYWNGITLINEFKIIQHTYNKLSSPKSKMDIFSNLFKCYFICCCWVLSYCDISLYEWSCFSLVFLAGCYWGITTLLSFVSS